MIIGIKHKMVGGIFFILVLFMVVTVISLHSANLLKKHVEMTYNHPLNVVRSSIRIEVLVKEMQRSMDDMVFSNKHIETEKYIKEIESLELEAVSYFTIIQKRILGKEGEELAANARKDFINWRTLRKEIIQLLDKGFYAEAQFINEGEEKILVENIINGVKKIENYALMKAKGFNISSSTIASRNRTITIIALLVISLISIYIAVFLSYSLTKRLALLNIATTAMANGNLEQRIEYKSHDELGQLALNFNIMADKLKKMYSSLESQVYERTAEIEKANRDLNTLKNSLEEKVETRTRELADKIKKLDKSQQAMLYMVEDLNETSHELKLEREKLDFANSELESFAYSVSHDLRAPLRAIHGFADILMTEYVEKLDNEAKRLCGIIIGNSIKMGNLIEDLLSFSRMGRRSLAKSKIDMKKMVISIFHEATTEDERKRIKLKVSDLQTVNGDPNMMRQVWMNLISNAIKFSSEKEIIKIEIQNTVSDNKIIYKIRDNGAGFDMKYKNKLFGVFQRLHNEKEFQGTGVGLALVQRIINRHGGNIWAESELGSGAIFYFSLPIGQSI